MKKTFLPWVCDHVSKQNLFASANEDQRRVIASYKRIIPKTLLLLVAFVFLGASAIAQQDVYWRSDAGTSNWWDGINPWYRTCDGWWLARVDYNQCNNNTTIGGNFVHFDNNNQTTMTVNGAWLKY